MMTLCRTRRHTEVELGGAKGSVSHSGHLMSSDVAPLTIEQENRWVPGRAQLMGKFPLS